MTVSLSDGGISYRMGVSFCWRLVSRRHLSKTRKENSQVYVLLLCLAMLYVCCALFHYVQHLCSSPVAA